MDDKVTILRKLKRFRFIFLGIFFGTLYWIIDACVDAYLLNEGTFFEQLLFPESHYIFMRSLMGAIILIFSIIVQFLANKHEEANRALEKSEERFRSLFEYIVDPVFLADPQTRQIVDCNNQAVKMIEYSKKELFSMRADELHPEDVREKTMEAFRKQAKGELQVVDTEVMTKSGKRIPVSINTSVVEIGGKPHMVGIFRDITERKWAEEALRESEEKYRSLFETSRDAIMTLVPPNWTFTSGNPSTIEMFKCRDEDEFTTKGPGDVSPETQPDGQLSSEKAKKMIMEAMEKGSKFFEWNHLRLDGEVFPATVLLTRMEIDGETLLQATVRDITERKRAEEALQESEEKHRLITESSSDLISKIDLEGNYIYASPSHRQLGYTEEYLLGKSGFDIVHPDDVEALMKIFVESLQDPEEATSKTLEFRIKDKTGNWHILESTANFIFNEAREPESILLVSRDITERKKLELELKQKNQELEDYTYTVSHDLKTPLVTIQGFAELLNAKYADQLDDKAKHYLDRITQGTDNLGTLVSDLLELSRAGRKTRPFELHDLNEILKVSLEGLEGKLMQKNIKITHPDNLPKVHCDDLRMEQVLSNLIGNSVKYMGDQQEPEVEIDWKENVGHYTFWVRDNGMGIREEDRDRIFKVFERAETGFDEEGSGIGLSIVKKIMQVHGGDIWVESEFGKGSTFYFELLKSGVKE